MSQLAERYAQALFELAKQEDAVVEYQMEVKQLIKIFDGNKQLQGFFNAVDITSVEKKELLEKAFKGKIKKMTYNFLNLLVDKKRMSHVTEILKTFNSLCNEERNVEEGIVYSARVLTEEQVERLEKALEAKLNKSVELSNLIDERLISGVKVIVGNQIIDVSMKNRIESLKYELLKESR